MLVQDVHIASKISELKQVFKGPEKSPFLAPRGVWLNGSQLVVSDTGQNRVFIWNELPNSEYANPNLVLGQESEEGTGRNQNHTVSASSLHYPSGLWTDGQKLIVADAWNHRVLIWHSFPTENGQPADVVLGQRDFESNEPNVDGLNAPTTAQSLYWPYGVFSNGEELWIADTGNRRVVYFKDIPTKSFAAADLVIGKPDLSCRDYEPNEPIWPYSVRVDDSGRLAITDTQYFRVLIWNNWKKAVGSTQPDFVLGQADMVANGQNQFKLSPNERTLNWCYDSFLHKDGIFVLDTANSRAKWYPEILENNQEADDLIGQPDFNTGSENVQNLKGTDTGLYWPFSICIEQQQLVIADTGNHRVLLNKLLV